MKHLHLCALICVLGACLLSSSCSIQKRHYTKGFFTQWRKHSVHVAPATRIGNDNTESLPVMVRPSDKTSHSFDQAPNEKDLSFASAATKVKASTIQINHGLKKTTFISHDSDTKVAPQSKTEDSSVNEPAFISLLLLVVFIAVSLSNIAGATAIAWICLIAGPVLAIVSRFYNKKKAGNFMVGLSMGLWAVLLAYILLLALL